MQVITHRMRDGFCIDCDEPAEWLAEVGAPMQTIETKPEPEAATWHVEYGTKTHLDRGDGKSYCGRTLAYRVLNETVPDCKTCLKHA